MIIDSHCHLLTDDKSGWHTFLDQCRKNGVSLALVSFLDCFKLYSNKEEVRSLNDKACGLARNSNGLVRWLVYINPQNENWGEEIDRGVEGGAIGIKLWVSLKDANGCLEKTAEVIQYAGNKKLPVLIHTFHRTAPNLPGEITLEELAMLAEHSPETTLIGAHAGGNWRHSLGVLRNRARNVYVDICGCFPEKGMVEALVQDIGANRILFGSDMIGRSTASQLAKVVFAEISEGEKELILWKNAVKVFNLSNLPPDKTPQIQSAPEWLDFRTEHFCFCGRWPFFETSCHTPRELDQLLAKAEIDRAYVADLGSIYQLDLEKANGRFSESVQGASRIIPLGILNPRAHNWKHLLASLKPKFTGAMACPYLHNWRLDDPSHANFFQCCAGKIPLWINCAFGDGRFCHSGLACRPVSADELIQFGKQAPGNAYVFQGLAASEIGAFMEHFPQDPRFRFEISKLTDCPGVLDQIRAKHGTTRLVLGSEFPLRDIRTVRWTLQRL